MDKCSESGAEENFLGEGSFGGFSPRKRVAALPRVSAASIGSKSEPLVRQQLVVERMPHSLRQSDSLAGLVLEHPRDEVEQLYVLVLLAYLIPL